MRVAFGFQGLLSACLLSTLATGCSTSFAPTAMQVDSNVVGAIVGSAFGGNQPLIGAQVYLYAAGTTGNGGLGIAASTANASSSLLTHVTTGAFPTTADGNGHYFVTTDANGAFSLTGDYTCINGSQVYIFVAGGDAGAGSNSSIGELAVLGQCPSTQTLATLVPHVTVNEVSTVAAAYALAGYATDATHISSSGTALALTGIANAAATASNLYDVSGFHGVVALAVTPAGNGVAPQGKVNTLGNVLAACVNSTGASSTQCSSLFSVATSGANGNGTTPVDTATAAINIAHNPMATAGSTLFNLPSGIGSPFQPVIVTVPYDWTLYITYSGGGILTYQANSDMVVDSKGNLWITNFANNALSKFSPLGAPLSGSTGFTGIGLNNPFPLIVDSSDNIWVGNFGNSTLSEISNAGAAITVVSGGLLQQPFRMKTDNNGNMWIVNHAANGGISEFSGTGTPITVSQGIGAYSPDIALEYDVAFDAAGNGFVPNGGNNGILVEFSQAGTQIGRSSDPNLGSVGGLAFPVGIAFDSSNNFWVANEWIDASKFNDAFTPLFANGVAAGGTGNTVPYIGSSGVAVDGGNHAWFSLFNDGIAELNSDGTALSPSANGFPVSSSSHIDPNSILLDGSGNVWITCLLSNSLVELVGAAVPVVAPLNPNKSGVRP